jgi:hypothetical protein
MDITAFFCLRQHCKPKQSLVWYWFDDWNAR